MLEREDIVCISSVDWDPIWTRKQQVMSRLPRSNRILYVEPPITLLSSFKDPAMWKKWGMWLLGMRILRENFYLYSPPVILPFGNKYRFINRVNQWWVNLFLKRVIKKLEFKKPILWTYMPNTADQLKGIDYKMLVYDCVDEHSEYTGLIDKTTMLEMEKKLLGKSDVVFVTAPGLYEAKKEKARRIFYLPNAANVKHFMKAQREDTLVPADIAGLPHPRIGFVGVIQDWIDLDLIAEVARRHPQWSVVLVGPVGVGIDVSMLTPLPNVHLLGRRDVQVLPNYLKGFDVCLNPFKINELTDKVSPLKFYEYLASGKPIVTVDMPGVREFADIVEVAEGREDFVARIEAALATESEEKKLQRLERAREHSWESRVRFMMEKILGGGKDNVECDHTGK
ncbi:MAG: glycosyltransferase [Thermincolia bacterium]